MPYLKYSARYNEKNLVLAVVLLTILGVGIYLFREQKSTTTYKTAKVERGDIVSSVFATGNLAAVVTVQVGTQVSGTIQKLFVDFNSKVAKGEVIAIIDPSLFAAQVEQTRGNFLAAQANLLRAKADLSNAERSLERNRQLVKEGIISQDDFDTVENRYEQTAALVKSAEGNVMQARGAFTHAETNLRYSIIRSPVDGIVVSRNVDVGQTVAASFQTPTLFTIAQDLTRMEIETSVDEADISRVKNGQSVTFTVDAYPDTHFKGIVRQVRNAPIVTQNVVTYVVVIGVDNKELKLKPGMTANVGIEVVHKNNVLKIPFAALRFRPKEMNEKLSATAESRRMNKENGQYVYILGEDNIAVPVLVKTGISNDRQVELVDGNLKENDEVIVGEVATRKKSGGMMSGRSSMRNRF